MCEKCIIPSSNKQPLYYLKATWLYKKKRGGVLGERGQRGGRKLKMG